MIAKGNSHWQLQQCSKDHNLLTTLVPPFIICCLNSLSCTSSFILRPLVCHVILAQYISHDVNISPHFALTELHFVTIISEHSITQRSLSLSATSHSMYKYIIYFSKIYIIPQVGYEAWQVYIRTINILMKMWFIFVICYLSYRNFWLRFSRIAHLNGNMSNPVLVDAPIQSTARDKCLQPPYYSQKAPCIWLHTSLALDGHSKLVVDLWPMNLVTTVTNKIQKKTNSITLNR